MWTMCVEKNQMDEDIIRAILLLRVNINNSVLWQTIIEDINLLGKIIFLGKQAHVAVASGADRSRII